MCEQRIYSVSPQSYYCRSENIFILITFELLDENLEPVDVPYRVIEPLCSCALSIFALKSGIFSTQVQVLC